MGGDAENPHRDLTERKTRDIGSGIGGNGWPTSNRQRHKTRPDEGDCGRRAERKKMKMVTIKEMKQNMVRLRSIKRQLNQASKEIADGQTKSAQRRITESQDEIASVIEWLEKTANSN